MTEMLGMKLRENLKKLIQEREMTSAQLARLAKVPKATLHDWSNGGLPGDIRKVKAVADVLEVSLDQLCFGDIEKAPKENHIDTYKNEINAGFFEVILRKRKQHD